MCSSTNKFIGTVFLRTSNMSKVRRRSTILTREQIRFDYDYAHDGFDESLQFKNRGGLSRGRCRKSKGRKPYNRGDSFAFCDDLQVSI